MHPLSSRHCANCRSLVARSACFILCAWACAGCGGAGYEHVTVTGTVTIDGQTVPRGSINFSPTGQGPVTGGLIENGKFEVERVPVGSHTVTFTAQSAETRKIRDVANDAVREVPIDILPNQYRTGVPTEVSKQKHELKFELTSKPAT